MSPRRAEGRGRGPGMRASGCASLGRAKGRAEGRVYVVNAAPSLGLYARLGGAVTRTRAEGRDTTMPRYRSYAGDPYWLTARYGGQCAKCGEAFPKGAEIFWYPRSKRAYFGPCGEAAARDFDTMAEAEHVLGGGH